VGDVLLRRTRIALQAARAVAAPDGTTAQRVADAMAPELGWDEAQARAHARAFLDEAGAEGIVTSP
jgi:glycerol-3-phosphate dehydrogenase